MLVHNQYKDGICYLMCVLAAANLFCIKQDFYFTIFSLHHHWRKGNLYQCLVSMFAVCSICGGHHQGSVHEGTSSQTSLLMGRSSLFLEMVNRKHSPCRRCSVPSLLLWLYGPTPFQDASAWLPGSGGRDFFFFFLIELITNSIMCLPLEFKMFCNISVLKSTCAKLSSSVWFVFPPADTHTHELPSRLQLKNIQYLIFWEQQTGTFDT